MEKERKKNVFKSLVLVVSGIFLGFIICFFLCFDVFMYVSEVAKSNETTVTEAKIEYPEVGDKILKEDLHVYVYFFSQNGLATVAYTPDDYRSTRYGYINREGIVTIPFQFEDADIFIYDRALVKENGLWGIINSSGEYILEPTYYDLNLSIKQYDKDGKTYHLFSAEKKDDFHTYYLDLDGNIYAVE